MGVALQQSFFDRKNSSRTLEEAHDGKCLWMAFTVCQIRQLTVDALARSWQVVLSGHWICLNDPSVDLQAPPEPFAFTHEHPIQGALLLETTTYDPALS